MFARRKPALKTDLGQLLIIGFDGTEMSPRLSSLLTRLQPGGVILFARNIKSAEQTWRLLRECQRCVSTPLFTCIDLEGGTVDRLRDVLGATPAATEVFATGDRKLFLKHGRIIGGNCRALGFNVDFAPVFDLAFEASRKVLSTRVVSADPREVIVYAREFLEGLKKAGVLGCGKHFPGLGEGTLDSHRELPVIDKPFKRLWNEDLLPYRRLRAQLPTVMVAHAAYPQVTTNRIPASISKTWITDILRKRIGYRNLVISDDLEMGGILAAASAGKAAVEHIAAGGDMLLVCHREAYVVQAYEELVRTAERDRNFAKQAAAAAQRVLTFKKKSAKLLRPASFPSPATVEKLSRQLWEFSEEVRVEALARDESFLGNGRRRGR
jgi:beta-N-acetylhexosaminidase